MADGKAQTGSKAERTRQYASILERFRNAAIGH
jgi:hypothetical protein